MSQGTGDQFGDLPEAQVRVTRAGAHDAGQLRSTDIHGQTSISVKDARPGRVQTFDLDCAARWIRLQRT